MQTVNYYTGAPANMDDSDQFMINARDMYTQQQMQTGPSNPYYTCNTNQGYTGPRPGSNLQFYQGNNLVGQQFVPQQPYPMYNQVNGLHYNTSGTNMSYQTQNGFVQAPNQMQLQYHQSPQMQYVPNNAQYMPNVAPNPQIYGYRDNGPGIVTYRNPGYVGNPAISYIEQRQQMGYQPMMYGNQQPQEKVVQVRGIDPLNGGKYLFSADTQDKLDQLQVDMVLENQQSLAKKELQAKRMSGSYLNNNFGGGFMYNPQLYGGIDPQVYSKYKAKVQEMAQEAEERRINFNKRLSKLCHSWLGDNTTDEEINKAYEGYTYTIPYETIQFANAQQRFENLVPVNTAPLYWAHDAQVTAEFRKYCPNGRSMNEFFNDATMIRIKDAEEQEKHRRRDGKLYYDQDIMHYYIRKYAKDNLIDDSGINYNKATKADIMKQMMGKENYKDLEDVGIKLTEDGHLDVSFDFSTAPQSLRDKLRDPSPTSSMPSGAMNGYGPVIQNENVIQYEQNRSKFFQSIMDTTKKINYDDGTGANTRNLVNTGPPNIAMGGG